MMRPKVDRSQRLPGAIGACVVLATLWVCLAPVFAGPGETGSGGAGPDGSESSREAESHFQRALELYQAGSRLEAVEAYLRAAELDAGILAEDDRGLVTDANRMFEELQRSNALDERGHYLYLTLANVTGERDKATALVNRFLANWPDSEHAPRLAKLKASLEAPPRDPVAEHRAQAASRTAEIEREIQELEALTAQLEQDLELERTHRGTTEETAAESDRKIAAYERKIAENQARLEELRQPRP